MLNKYQLKIFLSKNKLKLLSHFERHLFIQIKNL